MGTRLEMRWKSSDKATAGLAAVPGFMYLRRGLRRGKSLWKDLCVPEAGGCPGEVGCDMLGNSAWTSPPGHRLVRLLVSGRVT